ncbi:MAG TPA: polymer-forming cytoskeletal protein [Candidatus Saccharimonadales bacterium]|nr:polymer-forming cytoskeletal protein [Candidatus Saccharimonadales bacterium]
MKRRYIVLLAGCLVALPLALWGAVAHAQDFRSGDAVTVAAGRTVDNTLFASGHTIAIEGTVNGDVYCIGQTVDITGTVNGDVFCAGQNVSVSGAIHGSLHAAGQTVNIAAPVERSLAVAGQSVTIEYGTTVGGDAAIVGQSVTANGTVTRDLAVAGATVTLSGTVGRNVRAESNDILLNGGARVGGDFTYASAHALARADSATIAGTLTRKPLPVRHHSPLQVGVFFRIGAWFALYLFAAFVIMALALVLLAPQAFRLATEAAAGSPLWTIVVGLLSTIIAPVVIILLAVTLVGLPLAVILGLAWTVVLMVSGVFAAYYLGWLLIGKTTKNVVLVMLLGSVLLGLLYFIPVVGFVVMLLAGWVGCGMILRSLRGLPKPRYTVSAR